LQNTTQTIPTPISVATPETSSGYFATALSEQQLPALAARFGAWIGALLGRPVRFGRNILVTSHAHVTELLSRDLEFRIGPVNGERIEAVNGPFVLGMDRCVTLANERGALYDALAKVDLDPIRRAVAAEAAAKAAAVASIDVVGDYARPIAARTAQSLFGVTGPNDELFMDVARAVFAHIFLNISGDKVVERRALAAAEMMRKWLSAEIARRRAASDLGSDMMGALLGGDLDDEGVRRTLGGMLVGSIDTTASSVAKIIAVICRDQALKASVAADVDDPARLAGWCWEALRRWPHNPILLRQAVAATKLGTVDVRAGDKVIAWSQAAMLDASAFPNPLQLRPDRPAWTYLHFGGGLHPCAGRVVNGFQIPILVGALVRRGIKSIGPMKWAGPFPNHLSATFER
jgi:cytochrome P450